MDNPSFNQNGIEYNGEQIAYKDSTYELVSKVAYLIGVPLRIFQNEHEPPKIEICLMQLCETRGSKCLPQSGGSSMRSTSGT